MRSDVRIATALDSHYVRCLNDARCTCRKYAHTHMTETQNAYTGTTWMNMSRGTSGKEKWTKCNQTEMKWKCFYCWIRHFGVLKWRQSDVDDDWFNVNELTSNFDARPIWLSSGGYIFLRHENLLPPWIATLIAVFVSRHFVNWACCAQNVMQRERDGERERVYEYSFLNMTDTRTELMRRQQCLSPLVKMRPFENEWDTQSMGARANMNQLITLDVYRTQNKHNNRWAKSNDYILCYSNTLRHNGTFRWETIREWVGWTKNG